MTGFDDGATLGERFRRHGSMCNSPLYAALMLGLADDWDAGGVVRDVCSGWESAPVGSVVQLRLLAGLHRLVLRSEAPELATYYPTVGGHGSASGVWPVARRVIAAHVSQLHDGLSFAPQTNEVGRAAALAVGLTDAMSRSGSGRVRLLEVGASAGLNLLVDHVRIEGESWSWGPVESPVRLASAVLGSVVSQRVFIESRRGCDLSPIDAASADGRLLLSSYVWPDHLARFERLRAALQVASSSPVAVEVGSAGEWLERVLPGEDPDVLTVVWHSISRMYWPAQEVARVEAALAAAGRRMLLAHVQLEYLDPGDVGPRLVVQVWRDGVVDGRRTDLALVGDHGVPVTLHDGVRVADAGC